MGGQSTSADAGEADRSDPPILTDGNALFSELAPFLGVTRFRVSIQPRQTEKGIRKIDRDLGPRRTAGVEHRDESPNGSIKLMAYASHFHRLGDENGTRDVDRQARRPCVFKSVIETNFNNNQEIPSRNRPRLHAVSQRRHFAATRRPPTTASASERIAVTLTLISRCAKPLMPYDRQSFCRRSGFASRIT